MSLGPLVINLTATGISETINALSSVEKRMEAMERKTTDISRRSNKDRVDLVKRAEREKEAAYKKLTKEIEREAKKAADAEIREAKRVADERKRFFKQVTGSLTNGLREALGFATKLSGVLLSIGGGFTIGNAIQGQLSAQRAAMNFAVSTRVGDKSQRVEYNDVMRRTSDMARIHGYDQTDVINTAAAFTKPSGKGGLGLEMTDFILKVAKAEGIDPKELATVLGQAAAQNPNLSTTELKVLARMGVQQGKEGSVEFNDMARQLTGVTAQANSYAGDQGDNMAKLMSLMQVANLATGNAAESATAIERFGSDLATNRKDYMSITHGKYNPFDEHGKIKDINETIAVAFGETGGDITKLRKVFSERSIKLMQAISPIYENAEKKQKGSGKQAILDYLKEKETGSILSEDQLKKDYQDVMKTDAEALDRKFKELNIEIGEMLIPVLRQLVPVLAKAIPVIEEMLQAIISHPIAAAGIALAGWTAKVILSELAVTAFNNSMVSFIQYAGGLGNAMASAAAAILGFVNIINMWMDSFKAGKKGWEEGAAATPGSGSMPKGILEGLIGFGIGAGAKAPLSILQNVLGDSTPDIIKSFNSGVSDLQTDAIKNIRSSDTGNWLFGGDVAMKMKDEDAEAAGKKIAESFNREILPQSVDIGNNYIGPRGANGANLSGK